MKFSSKLCLLFILFAAVFSFTACTHIDRPSQTLSTSATVKDWGHNPPADKDQARHLIEGEKPFEWWYFDGHP